MGNKALFLSNLDAVKRTIEALPDDVRVCSINEFYVGKIEVIILRHPDITGEPVEVYDDGGVWFEKQYDVPVGWIGRVANGTDR